MLNELVLNNIGNLTMTLKEITDLLEVRHNNAMSTVEKMSKSPEFGDLLKISSSYKNNIGANIPIETYQLDKRQSIAVAAKLNTALLMRVIDRWQELEAANKVPQTFIEAMQLATQTLIKNEALRVSNMALTDQRDDLQIQLDQSTDWLSIKKVAAYNNVHWKTILWAPLKRHGIQTGHTPYKIFDANFPEGVNVYHRESWGGVYPALVLPGEEL